MSRYVSEASTGLNHTYSEHTGDHLINDVLHSLDGDPTLIQRRAQVEDAEGRRHQYSEQSRLCIVPAETDSIKENSSVSLGCMEREHAAIDAPVPAFESELVGITIAAPSRVAFPDGRRLVCGLKIAHDSPWQSLGVNRGVSY